MQVTSTSISGLSKPSQGVGQVDLSKIKSSIMELDTNKDGQISDSEFATYRARKQASGQFIPLKGPVDEKIQQTIFDALLARET